jgi:zinc D-Ala-D-Ala carboxypeptidase
LDILQPIRDKLGVVITVSSGYRCLELNRLVGGSPKSDHVLGCAVDLKVKNGENRLIFEAALELKLPFKQMIWEFGNKNNPDWVHIGYDETAVKPKREVLWAIKRAERTTYTSKTPYK